MTNVLPWMSYPLQEGDERMKANEALMTVNFRTGIAYGLAVRADSLEARVVELEAQLEIAFEYQRELDARLVELGMSPLRDLKSTYGSDALTGAADRIRNQVQ